MLLSKIDGEMNVQNCELSTKLWNGDGGDMHHDWRQWQLSRLSRHRFSKRWHVSDVKNIAGDDQTTLMVHRNSANISCTFRFYVCLRLRDRGCCSAADGSGSCHAPALSYFEEMTRCRRKKLHWRLPGNSNGRSKFCKLGLFTFIRSPLTLCWRLRGWWRLPEIAQTARNRRQKHCREDQDRSKFHKYDNLCLRDKAKRLEKLLFAATITAAIDGIGHFFFLLSLATAFVFTSKNNFSTTLTPTKKPRYIVFL